MDPNVSTNGLSEFDDPYVHEVPGVCGGYPVIRNTRIPVWIVVSFHRQGTSVDEIAVMYPHLSKEHIQGALDYYAAHPARVDEDFERNEHAYAKYERRKWPV